MTLNNEKEYKTVISFSRKTPMWAKWAFRITFILTTGISAWVAATNLVDEATKYEVTILLKLVIDPLVYGASKFFGLKEVNKYE
jgi:hypothetical protein